MRNIAFYLPQFHRVKENDLWWGEGYTEWVAVKNSEPMFENHYQPHVPLNENYYNLLEKETMLWQAELLKEYEIDGLCFYHYWFGTDEQILEKPAENLLNWKDVELPFCFSWANQSWINSWSKRKGFSWISGKTINSNNEILLHQIYGREEAWEKHFNYLLPFFKDNRYIKKDGKPVFVIQMIGDVACFAQMKEYWNKLAKRNGLEGIFFIGIGNHFMDYGTDFIMNHEPGMARNQLTPIKNDAGINIYDYALATNYILEKKNLVGRKEAYSTFCSFDNTPRYGKDGCVFMNATPESFYYQLCNVMAKNAVLGFDMVFIDAWNEWGEGMHLEPDEMYKLRWLEANKLAKRDYHKYVEKYKNEILYYDVKTSELLKEREKLSLYLASSDQWIKIKERGKNLCEYLCVCDVKSVLLYGYNFFADHLIVECNDYSVDVLGIIDKKELSGDFGLQWYKMGDKLTNVDAIVVCSFYYINEIVEEIARLYPEIRVFSLLELIQYHIDI